jgi:cytochrome c-type biogenesis protein CcmH/NrfG
VGTALGLVVATFFLHAVVNYDWSFLGVSGPFLLLGGVVAVRPGPPVRRPLLAVAATLFALGCVYSLAAPWLSQRAEARLHLESAHSYDPLSTSVLTLQAALADGREPERLYQDALALEPTNSSLWLELARFYAENGSWTNAYRALTRAYRYDPLGPAGQCGLAQQIRLKVGVRSSCRGAGLTRIP